MIPEVESDLRQYEKKKYEEMWTHPEYKQHSPGERHFDRAFTHLKPKPGDTLIDYGVGTGKMAFKFCERGLKVLGIDIANNCLIRDKDWPDNFTFKVENLWVFNEFPRKSKFGICTDVLEHIPENRVDQVLDRIYENTEHSGYISIHTGRDHFGPKYINKELHITVKPQEWWKEKLLKLWHCDFFFESSVLHVHFRKYREG